MRKIEKLLTTAEVADLLGIAPQTLVDWRCKKRHNLGFVRIGRSIRYHPDEVQRFIDSRTQAC